jgi:hypothetical protein
MLLPLRIDSARPLLRFAERFVQRRFALERAQPPQHPASAEAGQQQDCDPDDVSEGQCHRNPSDADANERFGERFEVPTGPQWSLDARGESDQNLVLPDAIACTRCIDSGSRMSEP